MLVEHSIVHIIGGFHPSSFEANIGVTKGDLDDVGAPTLIVLEYGSATLLYDTVTFYMGHVLEDLL